MCFRLICAGMPVKNENLTTASSSVSLPFLYSKRVLIDSRVYSSASFSIASIIHAVIKLTSYFSQKLLVFESTDLATK